MQVIEIYQAAQQAGYEAVQSAAIAPMIVQQRANPLDDSSRLQREYYVNDGVCGFASVIVKPANCKFAKFLKEQGLGRKHYYGGMSMSVRDFNQSLQKKEAYASAFAKVLNDNGITAYTESRMD